MKGSGRLVRRKIRTARKYEIESLEHRNGPLHRCLDGVDVHDSELMVDRRRCNVGNTIAQR